MSESACTLRQPSLHSSHTIPRDEINPDNLIVAFSTAISRLEAEAEAEGMAMNWESLQIGLTYPAFPGKTHEQYAIVNAVVKRLPL